MEEDNRSYSYSHSFRQFQRHRMMEVCDNDRPCVGGNQRSVLSSDSEQPYHVQRQMQETFPLESALPFLSSFVKVTSSTFNPKNTCSASNDHFARGMVEVEANNDHTTDTMRSSITIGRMVHRRGMIPIDDVSDQSQKSTRGDSHLLVNGEIRLQEVSRVQEDPRHSNRLRSKRLLEEANDLLHDYERRFYRQSLTERAKTLLDRARDKSIISTDETKLKLCSTALMECKNAIKDQEDALHSDHMNYVGGSYLVTGDIRIRRKGELLAAKIYCSRAGVLYRMSKYIECLDDCDAAIEIWRKHEQRSSSEIVRTTKRMRTAMSLSLTQNIPTTSVGKAVKGKLSQKYLYLLRGRALAAIGRYQEAAKWITNPFDLPFQKFHGTSQLLESDSRMYLLLHEIITRSGGNPKAKAASKYCGVDCRQQDDSDDFPADCSAKSPWRKSIIPTDKRLWAYLLYSIDRRLGNGSNSCFGIEQNGCISQGNASCSAIYHVLRNGPVLFHYFE